MERKKASDYPQELLNSSRLDPLTLRRSEDSFVDQVARVMLAVPSQIRRQTGFLDWNFREQGSDLFGGIEGQCGKRLQLPDEFFNWHARRYGRLGHGRMRQTIEYTVPSRC